MIVVQELIEKKRNGGTLTQSELEALVFGYTKGEIPDYQIAALFMAIYFRGLNVAEQTYFMNAKIRTGTPFDWSEYRGNRIFVDKHSTGGVGDKTSLVILPLLIADGFDVPMVCGRGLGHTGGTVDKLEAIPGMVVQISHDKFKNCIQNFHGAFGAQTQDFVPADKKMYALRDVTATVASIGLITASIMSKKLSEDLDALVLDVKFGSGGFMETFEKSYELAKNMYDVGNNAGCKTIAALTNMNEPLGRSVGNACEVNECLDVLCGAGARDTRELSLRLAAGAAAAARGKNSIEDIEIAYSRLKNHLDSGRAFEIFCQIIVAQGGSLEAVERKNMTWITGKTKSKEIFSNETGIVASIDTKALGLALVELGGGRRTKEDTINPLVGFTELRRVGESVDSQTPLAVIHYDELAEPSHVMKRVLDAYKICDKLETDANEPLIKNWIL